MPVSVVFQNLEAGATIDQIVEWFDVAPELVKTVIEFAARSLEAPAPGAGAGALRPRYAGPATGCGRQSSLMGIGTVLWDELR